MAWVVADETDSSKYHLYIGGDGGIIANKDSSYLFRNFTNLQTITFGDNFDTSNVTDMSSMFQSCSSLTELDVSNFDTSNVTSMSQMFDNCSSLTQLALCNWNTTNVTNMKYMFRGTSNVNSIYVGPNWTTENATTTYMFSSSGVSSVTQSDNCETIAQNAN